MKSLLSSLSLLLLLVISNAWAENPRMQLRPAFDAEQRAWLREHPVLRVGLVQQAPWVQRGQNRQLTGANVELMQRLLDGMGVAPDWRLYPSLEALEASANLPVGQQFALNGRNSPLLVTFTDIHDPTSVRQVDPHHLAAAFGPDFVLKAITLEITNEAVTRGRVEKVLGWILSAEYIIPPAQQP